MTSRLDFPIWPPGFSRRIVLSPSRDWIGAALEDDAHSFWFRLDHAEGRITAVAGKALRHPWSACPGAVNKLEAELPGARLEDIAARDPREDCTHLFDLAILCAAHAADTAPLRFDMTVADRVEGGTTATLAENGVDRMMWRIDGLEIMEPEPFAGRDLRRLSQWKRELSPENAERAALLRRTVFVSGVRRFVPQPGEYAADQGPTRMGACYNYQLPQAQDSTRIADWQKDFSESGLQPLGGFDPEKDFAVLGMARRNTRS